MVGASPFAFVGDNTNKGGKRRAIIKNSRNFLTVVLTPATKISFTVSGKKQVTMKAVITAFFAGLVLFSCTKSNGTTGPDSITGKWELRMSSGGFAGTIIYPPGNGTVVIFSNNRQFRFTNTIVTDSGTYNIKKAAAPGSYLLELQYVYNGQTQATSDSIKVNGNQLIFFPASSCCDVPTTMYIKIR